MSSSLGAFCEELFVILWRSNNFLIDLRTSTGHGHDIFISPPKRRWAKNLLKLKTLQKCCFESERASHKKKCHDVGVSFEILLLSALKYFLWGEILFFSAKNGTELKHILMMIIIISYKKYLDTKIYIYIIIMHSMSLILQDLIIEGENKI